MKIKNITSYKYKGTWYFKVDNNLKFKGLRKLSNFLGVNYYTIRSVWYLSKYSDGLFTYKVQAMLIKKANHINKHCCVSLNKTNPRTVSPHKMRDCYQNLQHKRQKLSGWADLSDVKRDKNLNKIPELTSFEEQLYGGSRK